MSAQILSNYLQGMHNYHAYNQTGWGNFGGGGFGGTFAPTFGGGMGSRNVHVVAGDTGTLRELRTQEKEDRDDARATSAAWLGGAALLLFSGGLAFTLKSWMRDREELQKAIDFKNEDLQNLRGWQQRELKPILKQHISILEKNCSKSRNITLLTGTILGAAGAAFLGGMFSIQWLITAAVIAGVTAAALGIFSAVWYCMDEKALSPDMMRQLEALQRQIG